MSALRRMDSVSKCSLFALAFSWMMFGQGVVADPTLFDPSGDIPPDYVVVDGPDLKDHVHRWFTAEGDEVVMAGHYFGEGGIFHRLETSGSTYRKVNGSWSNWATLDAQTHCVVYLGRENFGPTAPENLSPTDVIRFEMQNADYVDYIGTVNYRTGEEARIAAFRFPKPEGARALGVHGDRLLMARFSTAGTVFVDVFDRNPAVIQDRPRESHRFLETDGADLLSVFHPTNGYLYYRLRDLSEPINGFKQVIMRASPPDYDASTFVCGGPLGEWIVDICVSRHGDELALLTREEPTSVYKLYRVNLGAPSSEPRLVKTGETHWFPKKVAYGRTGELLVHGDLFGFAQKTVSAKTLRPYENLKTAFVDPGAER